MPRTVNGTRKGAAAPFDALSPPDTGCYVARASAFRSASPGRRTGSTAPCAPRRGCPLKSTNREALTEYMIALADVQAA